MATRRSRASPGAATAREVASSVLFVRTPSRDAGSAHAWTTPHTRKEGATRGNQGFPRGSPLLRDVRAGLSAERSGDLVPAPGGSRGARAARAGLERA